MKFRRIPSLLLLIAVLAGCSGGSPAVSGSEPETSLDGPLPYVEIPDPYRAWDASGQIREHTRSASGTGGIVSSLKYEASAIGTQILEHGGNAADAAVAVSLALSVCEPYDSGPGGGGMALYYKKETGATHYLNFRETAPAAQDSLTLEDGSESLGKQIGTPSLLRGIYELWDQYGTLPWSELVAPSVELARQGFRATPALIAAIEVLYADMAASPELSEIYLKDGLPPQPGDLIRNEPLARVLESVAEHGPDAIFTGETADAMVSCARAAGSGLTQSDLDSYTTVSAEPARGSYRDLSIVSSPWGGSCLIEALNLLELLPVEPSGTLEQLSQMAEVQKLVFADRAAYLGDDRMQDLPLSGLASKPYAAQRVTDYIPGTVGRYSAGDPWPFEEEEENTTGFVIADKDGNVMALTQTINGYWGSHVYVEGCGFFLNNELNDFDRHPGRPNSYAPGKTPLSSMSPAIIFSPDSSPVLALSAPGGLMIWPSLVQVIQNLADYGMSLDDALNAPRVCTNGEFFYCDTDLPESARAGLESMGYSGLSTKLSIARPAGLRIQGDLREGSAECRGDAASINDCAALCTGLGTVPEASS